MSRRPSLFLIALVALVVGILPPAAVSAAATATLVTGTVVPHNPPMDGVVGLDLRVRNDTTNAWAAGDLVHLTWKGADGKPVTADTRQL